MLRHTNSSATGHNFVFLSEDFWGGIKEKMKVLIFTYSSQLPSFSLFVFSRYLSYHLSHLSAQLQVKFLSKITD